MRVFSASIETFLQRLTVYIKNILSIDFRVRVGRTRFRAADGMSWPIVVVAIDDRNRLGYFDSSNLTIGINKCLMYTAKNRVLKDLLRHELAHYFTHIEYRNPDCAAHGTEFQAICDKYRLSARVRAATMDVREENEAIEGDLESEAIIARIQKLMSLAESDNENEAALATVRANELLTKYNLDAIAASGRAAKEVEYCVKLVLPYKRSSPRASAIAQILGQFFVYPVHTSAGLEVTGTRANVDNAEYIASFLNRELDLLWKRARAGNRRLKQKSFMAALATSYTDKLHAARGRLPRDDRHALVLMNRDLEWAGHGIYGGSLQSRSSSYRDCAESASRGAEAGSNLEIRRGVSSRGVIKLLDA